MTTLRKAVAQALDALTKIHPGNMSWETGGAWMNAVQILREALAQPEQEPVAWMDSNGDVYPMPETEGWRPPHTLLYTHPPQRPAKPVGWLRAIDEAMVVHGCGVADPSDDYETAKRKLNTLLCIAQDIGSYFASQQQPPQHKPLTDESIGEVSIQDTQYHGYAMAIKPHIKDVLPEGTKLYTHPPQRKPLPPQSPCEMTQAKRKMFRLGWLECEAAHGIKGEQHG